MSFQRFALFFASALALILACLSRGDADPDPTISARELLTLTQASTGANYTFDQETAKLLGEVSVPRPAADATRGALEAALHDSGFFLSAVGPAEKPVFLVQRVGG